MNFSEFTVSAGKARAFLALKRATQESYWLSRSCYWCLLVQQIAHHVRVDSTEFCASCYRFPRIKHV